MSLKENINRMHFYRFSGIPNSWYNDNDGQFTNDYFQDKDYEDFYFDNFYDMDEMFGHETSLFGTKGLPVGHPDRSSRSFDMYNKHYGPMIVRVVNKDRLQENIERIHEIIGGGQYKGVGK